jgi:TetR/AcrR family transcriptional regulator, mexJK operon transcriptional repressor
MTTAAGSMAIMRRHPDLPSNHRAIPQTRITAANRATITVRLRAAIIRSNKHAIIRAADIMAISRQVAITKIREDIIRRRSIISPVNIQVHHKVIMVRNPAITIPRPAIKQARKTKATVQHPQKAKPRTGGRPSREASVKLADKILDVATEHFLRDGYGPISIEMVARDARVSKRTLYQRFANKAVLFTSVVHRIVERLRPKNDASFLEGDDLEEILLRLAKYILDATLTPDALALYRVIVAESIRFPELAGAVSRGNASAEAVHRIGALLEREAAAGRIRVQSTAFAAAQFLYMIIAIPQRRALGMGEPMSGAERAEWACNTVTLFLNGCRGAVPSLAVPKHGSKSK